jgi:hypothetical protein
MDPADVPERRSIPTLRVSTSLSILPSAAGGRASSTAGAALEPSLPTWPNSPRPAK